jgi:DNA-binding NtrC family response regulator
VFRADLLFRLNTIVLRVPPLRERREDVPLLLRHYLQMYEAQYQRPSRHIAASAMDVLLRHDWPGNVRALRHACERAVILGQGMEYAAADFGLASTVAMATGAAAATTFASASAISAGAAAGAAPAADAIAQAVVHGAVAGTPMAASPASMLAAATTAGDTTLDAIERAAIASTLAQFNGNISHAAKTLGISRAALYRKLGKHGI